MMRRSPLVRVAFKRPDSSAPAALTSSGLCRAAGIKRRTPKKRVGHNKVMRHACKDQKCFLKMPGCRSYKGDPTVVPAHRNQGKGMGLKVDDTLTVPACYHCHTAYDQGPMNRTIKRVRWDRAYVRWVEVRDAQEGA